MPKYGSTLPPWSAAHAYTNLYGPKSADKVITATVTGNVRVTEVGKTAGSDYDTHHIVLDFGAMPFPVLEGQSIAIIPPGTDANGRTHHARQYSIASPRNGERPGYNNVSLTIKRVLEDHQGQPVRGVASNFMCDLAVGDFVWTGGDCHIYDNHQDQVALQLTREPRPWPTLALKRRPASMFDYAYEDFEVQGYDPHPAIAAPVAV